MQSKLAAALSPKRFFFPRDNHWQKRIALVFSFILFDYFSTLTFCHAPFEEANPYARAFMESFGISPGLTLFVMLANLPLYISLSLDSNIIKLPKKAATIVEPFVDIIFAWFVAGAHFSGGTSWFWCSQDLMRQAFGAFLYLAIAFLFVKPHKPYYQ
jgi:hypothetical protein